MQALVGELANAPLDADHLLWQLHLIDGYEGGSALVARVHHCIGDGIALISVMLSITDGGIDPPKRKPRAAPEGDGDWLSDAVMKPLTDLATKAIGMYGGGVGKTLEMLSNPQHGLLGSREMARTGAKVLGDVGAMAMMPNDSPTLLKGKPIGKKIVAWGEPLPLAKVKAIGKALNCSINDVLFACVAGAIGAWLRDQGDDSAGKEIRAMVPVNLRPIEQAWQLGNRSGLAPLTLPIGIDNPIERVYAVRMRMNQLKDNYQPLLAFAVLAVAGLLIKPVQDGLLGLFAKKATAVMTNVPGHGRGVEVLRRDAAADDVLGTGLGRHRRRRVDPVVPRRGAVRADHRQEALPASAADHRPLRAGVREAVAGDDDAAVGVIPISDDRP